jgi:TP901 family phage tail tape measure protein
VATLASLILRLSLDKSMFTSGLAQGKAEANDFAVGVERSMGQAAVAAEEAGAKMQAAQNIIYGPNRGAGGRFISPFTMILDDAPKAEAAMENVAVAEEKVTTSTSMLNSTLETTKFLLASFLIIGFITFLSDAAKAAINFQSSMLLIQTQARASADEVRNMSDALLNMAPALRTGPEELAQGLYHIESVGLRGAKALDVLAAAAEGARVGNANLEDVTNALVASVTSGIAGVNGMSQAMGTLNGIVGSGNMRMEDLAKSLSSGVLATAKAFGLTIQDVGAALADMTDQGIPAQEAATRLRITIAQIGAPTKAAADQLSRIGLSSRDLADQMRGPAGLVGALRMLEDHLQRSGLDATEQAQLLKAAFGGSRSSAGLLTLIGSLDLLDKKMVTIKSSEQNFGEIARIQAESWAGQMQRLGATIDVLKIKLGSALAPVLMVVANVFDTLATHTEILVPVMMSLLAIMTLIATKAIVGFVAGMVESAGSMLLASAASVGLTAEFIAMTASEVAAAFATGGLSAAFDVLAAALGLVIAPIAIAGAAFVAIGVAVALLITNFDRVAQGVRVLAYYFWQGVASILDAASQLPFVGDQFKGLAAGAHATADAIRVEMARAEDNINEKANAINAAAALADPTKVIAQSIADGTNSVIDESKSMVDLFGTSLEGVKKAAGAAGTDAMSQMAKDILAHQNAPMDALKTLTDMEKNALTPAVETARLYGELASKALKDGLASQDPAVYAQAVATKQGIISRLDELTNGLYSEGQQAALNLSKGFNQTMIDERPHFDAAGKEMYGPFVTTSETVKKAADAIKPSAKAIADAMGMVADAAGMVAAAYDTSMRAVVAASKTVGADAMAAMAKSIADNRDKPKQQFDALVALMKSSLSPMKEIAQDLGILTSKTLAKALKDNRPDVRAQAYATAQSAAERLGELALQGGKIGKAAMDALDKGIKSKNKDVHDTSLHVKNIVVAQLNATKTPAATAGEKAAAAFAAAFWKKFQDFHIQLDIQAELNPNRHYSGYASGAWNIARTQLAWIHKGEMVIPAIPAARLREGQSKMYTPFPQMAMSPAIGAAVKQGPTVDISGGIHIHTGSDVSPARAHQFGQLVADELAAALRQQTSRLGTKVASN